MKALIVEDSLHDQQQIEDLLKARNVGYDIARDRVTAGRRIVTSDYDFIFLDMALAQDRHAGSFLLNVMKQQGLHIPTVLVSRFANHPEVKMLRSVYPFVVEVIEKRDLPHVIPAVNRHLDEASQGKGSQSRLRAGHQNAAEPGERAVAGGRLIAYTAALAGILIAGVGALGFLISTFRGNAWWTNLAVSVFLLLIVAAGYVLYGRGAMHGASQILRDIIRNRDGSRR